MDITDREILPPVKKVGDLLVLCWNCHGLMDKIPTFAHWLDNDLVDVIALQETLLRNPIVSDAYHVASSPFESRNDGNSVKGGLTLLGSKKVKATFRGILHSSQEIIKVQVGDVVISNVYVAPSKSLEIFENVMSIAAGSDIIMGDFNCPPLLKSSFIPSKSSTESEKRRYYSLSDAITRNDSTLASIPDIGNTSRLDHIWIRNTIGKTGYSYVPPTELSYILGSDHGLLWLHVKDFTSNVIKVKTKSECIRFKTMYLDRPYVRIKLLNAWKLSCQDWGDKVEFLESFVNGKVLDKAHDET